MLAAGRRGRRSKRALGEDHVVGDEARRTCSSWSASSDVHLVGEVAGGQPADLVGAARRPASTFLRVADLAAQRRVRGLGRRRLAADTPVRPRGRGRAAARSVSARAGLRRSSSWGCAARSCAAAGRARCHRRRTGRAGRALAGAAGALLAVGLAATAADLATRLGLVGALTGGGQLRRRPPGGSAGCWPSRRRSRRAARRSRSCRPRRRGRRRRVSLMPLSVLGRGARPGTRPPLGAGDRALDQQQAPCSASTAWTVEVLDGDPLVAHAARPCAGP